MINYLQERTKLNILPLNIYHSALVVHMKKALVGYYSKNINFLLKIINQIKLRGISMKKGDFYKLIF